MEPGSAKTDTDTPEKNAGKLQAELSPQVVTVARTCLDHAEDLIRGAKRLIEADLHHIAYHLAALALEEIGKADLVVMRSIASGRDAESTLGKYAEDHIKKLFWALWGPEFGRQLITKEQIESLRGLAQRIHATRLSGIYVVPTPEDFVPPRELVTREEAENLTSLAESRLGMEKALQPKQLSNEEREELSWFLATTEDDEKRRFIFSRKSMEKLVELRNVAGWVSWLHKQFMEADTQAAEMVKRELTREEPKGKDKLTPKWRFRIRLHTASHSLRPKILNFWNNGVDWIKLVPVDKKKQQVLVDFTLGAGVPVQGLFDVGMNVSQRLLLAFNIGTGGFFWWYLPEHISRYYEELEDLESRTKLGVELNPRLTIDWRRAALTEQEVRNVKLCFAMIPRPGKDEKSQALSHYLHGLALLARNDLHLRLEHSACLAFFQALQLAMKGFGDWNELMSFEEAFMTQLEELIPKEEARREFLGLGMTLERQELPKEGVTLTDAGGMKIIFDAYLFRKFRSMADERERAMQRRSASRKNGE